VVGKLTEHGIEFRGAAPSHVGTPWTELARRAGVIYIMSVKTIFPTRNRPVVGKITGAVFLS
jgi:hypothetical protein